MDRCTCGSPDQTCKLPLVKHLQLVVMVMTEEEEEEEEEAMRGRRLTWCKSEEEIPEMLPPLLAQMELSHSRRRR